MHSRPEDMNFFYLQPCIADLKTWFLLPITMHSRPEDMNFFYRIQPWIQAWRHEFLLLTIMHESMNYNHSRHEFFDSFIYSRLETWISSKASRLHPQKTERHEILLQHHTQLNDMYSSTATFIADLKTWISSTATSHSKKEYITSYIYERQKENDFFPQQQDMTLFYRYKYDRLK